MIITAMIGKVVPLVSLREIRNCKARHRNSYRLNLSKYVTFLSQKPGIRASMYAVITPNSMDL